MHYERLELARMGWFWEFWHWWTTGRIAATAAASGGMTAVITGSTAVRSLRHNRDATRRTTRPMMVGTLKLSGKVTSCIEVTNAGPSFARDVQVTFDPPLPTHEHTDDGQLSNIPPIRRRFSLPIATWAPGYTTRSEFHVLSDQLDAEGRPMNIDGIPRETAIQFSYSDDDGNVYSDSFSLDPTLIEGETWVVHRHNQGGVEHVEHDGAPW